jgi:hypothetical protein
MIRTSQALLSFVLSLVVTGVSAAQESTLERVKSEAARLRQGSPPPEADFWKELKAIRDRSVGLQIAIRDWVESVLPKSKAALDVEFPFLNPKVNTDLQRAGLFASNNSGDPFKSNPGSATEVEFSRPPEDADKLVVTTGIDVPCGRDDAVYVYDYSQEQPRRVLEAHGTRDHDETISDIRFSKSDALGNQLILTLRYGAQCGSNWETLSYDLFRLSATASTAIPILSGTHGIFLGDMSYQLRLAPDDLLIEVRDRSIDAGIHNRAHVLHFQTTGSTAERVDPVALQPQDFVDEWLTRPWSEMESRSAESGRDKLKKWHEFLAGNFVAGEFQFVQLCQEQTDQWQVAVYLDWIKGKELPEGLMVYFLVQQSDKYRFKITSISFDRQEGCPGESQPSSERPTLFPANEKKQ